MSQTVRPSSVFEAVRTPFHLRTEDGIDLIGEVATPIGGSKVRFCAYIRCQLQAE